MTGPNQHELLDRLIRCVDLTSLRGDENEAQIRGLCAFAAEQRAAAVCVYADWVPIAVAELDKTDVAVATVINFPGGNEDIDAVVSAAVAVANNGVNEVDLVAPLKAIEDGDVELVTEYALRVREKLPDQRLKMILETGRLAVPSLITSVARAAIMGGVDFLKTSTGKTEVGATPEAVSVLMDVIAEANGRAGLKVSGGVRTTADAVGYAVIAKDRMGDDWLGPDRFRIGASSLLDALIASRTETYAQR